MPHACKGNAPVNVKEKYVFVQAIKRGLEYGCVHVCVSSLNKSPIHSYLCVYMCVCVIGSAIKEAPRDVCVIVHM